MAILDVKDNTFPSKVHNQGLQEGLAKGVPQGIERRIRSAMLTRRVGPIPAGLEEKIRSGARSDVERWMLRLMDCVAAGEVLSGAEA